MSTEQKARSAPVKKTRRQQSLPNPGRYEDIGRETKNITGHHEIFDGFRFSYNLGLNKNFQIGHHINLGSTEDPAGNYQFAVDLGNEQMVMNNRIDTNGQAITQAFCDFKSFTTRAHIQTTREKEYDFQWALEFDKKAKESTTQVKIIKGGLFTISYLKSLTRALALGLEHTFVYPQAMNLWAIGGTYQWNKAVKSHLEFLLAPMADKYSISYVQKPAQGLALTAELSRDTDHETRQPRNMATIGAAWFFHQSSIKMQYNTNQQFSMILMEDSGLGVPLFTNFSAILDYKKSVYKIGFGITLQI